jgi:hypothetical protein
MPREERRRAPRCVPLPGDRLARVRLRTGRELAVVDISTCGVLVEGARLLPGTHTDVHVVTRHGRTLVRSRVVRSLVWHLEANAVCYRSALTFETVVDIETDGYPVPTENPAITREAGTAYPDLESSDSA